MTAPLQKMTDRERRLLLDVGLRHNYAAVGDRWVEVKLADAKKLGLRGGSESWGCRLCPATAPRGIAIIHDEDCPWAVLFDERLTDDQLYQGKAQLHLRRESRRRLNEQERRKSDRRKRVP